MSTRLGTDSTKTQQHASDKPSTTEACDKEEKTPLKSHPTLTELQPRRS
jgi:hypothetical protein